jgi:hypothetical protein
MRFRALLFLTLFACGSVPDETSIPPGGRLFPPAGVIRGTVTYQGPRPCSRNGHIVGNAIVLLFDRRNPPPPRGLANTAVNFVAVTGDSLFVNEPRWTGTQPYCPVDHGFKETITVAAPFAVSPLDGGSYLLEAFFDYTGDFLPTFKFRNLPERGDIAGGDLDTADALKPGNAGNPNYAPRFLPVDVGIAQPLPDGAPPDAVPSFIVPSSGFVADDVSVTIGLPLPLARPYFYPQGMQVVFDPNNPDTISTTVGWSSDAPAQVQVPSALENPNDASYPNYAPVLTMPQDIQIFAQPMVPTPGNGNHFEQAFPHLRIQAGVPQGELMAAEASPFSLQIPPSGGSLFVWQNAAQDATGTYVPQNIPESAAVPVPQLWPLVVLSKLSDDPTKDMTFGVAGTDPASLNAQGGPGVPVVVLQAITLLPEAMGESIVDTALLHSKPYFADAANTQPNLFPSDHVTVLLRPAVICFDSLFDATNPDKRGVLVTPWAMGTTADLPTGTPNQPIIDPKGLLANAQFAALVRDVQFGCLPVGRYAVNVVYPDGQAWTVPNEAGSCAGPNSAEGKTDYGMTPPTCTLKPRPILYSQGNRAVVEITPAADMTHCQGMQAVPAVCLPK